MKFKTPFFAADQSMGGGMQSSNRSAVAGAVNTLYPEARRRLDPVSFAAGSTVARDIPRDTSVKRISIALQGGVTVTYASGSPTLSPLGAASALSPVINVNADGSRNIKNVDAHMMRLLSAMATGAMPRRAVQTGASLVSTTLLPTLTWKRGAVTYPATTQDIIVSEEFDLWFECPWAYSVGRENSLLYTRDLSSCTLNFNFGSLDALQTTGVGATVTYSNNNFQFVPTIIEARDAPKEMGLIDFQETVIRRNFSGETRDFPVDLNRGKKLIGVAMLARNGDTNRSLADRVIRDLQLVVNGSNIIQKSTFLDLQIDNVNRYGIEDDFAAASSPFGAGHPCQGFAYMNLLKFGDGRTGLDTSIAAGVDQVQMLVTTAASSGVDSATYTNNVELSILQQEFAPVLK